MSEIQFKREVGIFAENGAVRLDIGSAAVKETPASHDSWATRLVVRNLSGTNYGPVSESDVIGIFSQDGRCRLDVGSNAMRKEVPADHDSWATRLVIKKLDSPESFDELKYGDVVGVYSSDGRCRLDIGNGSMLREVAASHDSWATRLKIKYLDPVDRTELESIDYKIDAGKILDSEQKNLYDETVSNSTPTAQLSHLHGKVALSETYGWEHSVGAEVTVETSFKTKIPLYVESQIKLSVKASYAYKWNGSTTTEREQGFDAEISVPPGATYVCKVASSEAKITVPYTAKVRNIHRSGKIDSEVIEGLFTGCNVFSVTVKIYQLNPTTRALSLVSARLVFLQ